MKMKMLMMTRANMFVSILRLFVIATMTAKTVMSASSVIPVKVTMDNKTYYPHQSMNINITMNITNTTTGSVSSEEENLVQYLTLTFVHANTTKRDVIRDYNNILDVTVQKFETTSILSGTRQFVVRNPLLARGFYKFFVSISNTTVEYFATLVPPEMQLTSKAYRVLPLLLRMETMQNRRRFLQGEVIDPIRFTTDPYFDYKYNSSMNTNPKWYYGYKGYIIPNNFPNKTLYDETTNGRPENSWFTSIGVSGGPYFEIYRTRLPAGAYKIGIFKREFEWYDDVTYVTSIPNSKFIIEQNNLTISLNQKMYKKGETIIASISSTKFLPTPLHHYREPINFYVSNRKYGGNFYETGKFFPVDGTNQTLVRSIYIDSDEVGTYVISTTYGTATPLVKEFIYGL